MLYGAKRWFPARAVSAALQFVSGFYFFAVASLTPARELLAARRGTALLPAPAAAAEAEESGEVSSMRHGHSLQL